MKNEYALMSWIEAREAAASRRVVILPIGSMDANGPQTPMGFDYLVSMALAQRVTDSTHDIWMPGLAYGVSQDLDAFPGTIAIPGDLVGALTYRILSSLVKGGFRHIMLITNHGPNQSPVEAACRRVRRERGVLMASINPAQLTKDLAGDLFPPEAVGHGAEPGSSLLSYLHPGAVRRDLFMPRPRNDFQGLEVLGPSEVRHAQSRVNLFLELEEVSPTSGWSDPTTSSAEKGEVLFQRMVSFVASFVETFRQLDTEATPPEIWSQPT
jgi:creatinine amidohydrolase